MLIRIATIQDIPSIQQIAYATWPATYGAILSEAQLQYMLEMMYSEEALHKQFEERHWFYIADITSQPQGFASVSKEEEGIFKLNKLYVLPAIQKTGAGKALLDAVIAYVKQQGGQQLTLQVNRYNNAKDFYIKHGFTILHEADFHIGNGYYMNDYIMGRGL